MSTWRVGAEAGAESRAADRGVAFGAGQVPEVAGTAMDRLTKWIPGDVLALYVAAVTAFAAADGARPSMVLLITFIVLSAAFVLGAAFSVAGTIPPNTKLPAALSTIAFTIWSLSVPFSGWQRWDFVAENQAAVAICAGIVALLFGFIAEGLAKRAHAAPDVMPSPPH